MINTLAAQDKYVEWQIAKLNIRLFLNHFESKDFESFKSKDVTHISLHDRGQVGEQQLAHQIDIGDSFLARRCCGVGW